MAVAPRFFQNPGQSFFLFGPRGTGKSTWLRHSFPSALFVDLLDPETFRSYSARPERLKAAIEGRSNLESVVIDEIQKLPELLDLVHLLIERHPGIQFILTGSSARKLKRAGVDLLAGRALVKTMHPFMMAETVVPISLEDALTTGLIPLITESANPHETLRAYVAVYLKQEVQMEAMVRNIGSFSRFLEAITFSHGAILNVAAVARECQVKRKTVEGFVSVLEDLLLAFQVPVFSRRAKRHLSSHPKFFYVDAGVFRSLRPTGPIDNPQEIDGAALEGLVAQHLRAWTAYRGSDARLFFWRTKTGVEVNFVLYGQDTFCAIEVKNTLRIQPKMLAGLTRFREDYPEAQILLLYRGRERLRVNDVLCLPCDEFLKNLTPHRPVAEGIKD
jgi:predicted AAA+ superfamily ATPase